MKILSRFLLTLLITFSLDSLTKRWAELNLDAYEPVPIIGDFFRLTLGYNTGVAFGLFANGGSWPLIITGAVIFALLIWFTKALYSGVFSALAAWPAGLLLGGAIGNFVDRLPDGKVTDFLDVGIGATRWPTFNLADSCILIGVALIILTSNPKSDENGVVQFEDVPADGEVDTLLTDVGNKL